jgi:hypothetical protein
MKVRPAQFEVGQYVWMHYPRRMQNLTEKWSNYYIGPYKVERRINSVLYQIRKSPRSHVKMCYVDKMKLYYGEVPAAWSSKEKEIDLSPMDQELHESSEPDDLVQTRPQRNAQRPIRYRDNE